MISLEQALGMALASVVLIAVPGPSVMFVVGRALSYGRATALYSVVGNAVGCYSLGLLIALGLGPLFERSEVLFQAVKWAGVLYLLYLGVQAIRHAGAAGASSGEAGARRGAPAGAWATIRSGALVGVTNPKSLVLFTAIVPQFVEPSAGGATAQMLVLGCVPLVIGLTTDAGWALVASTARSWLTGSPRRMRSIGRVGGASIVGVGVSVALTGSH
ncbi:LysE family translocator [Rothia sp. AR01]|uniref:LysE family translocator n=1 Tax=Rothia santali TaxID=2949643 RepID=A0A9X2KJE4_9MICC|nr:LysE family translocator [Rothia santali]MCP3426759.1 LysE family translocator [Rothia santali]